MIALVDDSLLDLRYSSMCLRKAGYETTEIHPVGTAQLAQSMAALRRVSPDLIVLDFHIPAFPTHFLAQLCREDPGLRTVPILLLTAHRELANVPRLQQIAPAGILFKPCKANSLVQSVGNLLGNRLSVV